MKSIYHFKKSLLLAKKKVSNETIASRNFDLRISLSLIILVTSVIMLATSCSKWVQVNPPNTALTGENIYTNNGTAASVLTGIYTNLGSNNSPFVTGKNSISVKCGLSADELTLYGVSSASQDFGPYYQNHLTNLTPTPFWNTFYQLLLQINSSIDGLDNSTTLTPSVKQQLLGESEFMRAFVNFYLVNLYGNCKYPLSQTASFRLL